MCLMERSIYSLFPPIPSLTIDWEESFNSEKVILKDSSYTFFDISDMILFLNLLILTTNCLQHQNPHFLIVDKIMHILASCEFFSYLLSTGDVVHGVPLT